MGLGSLSNFANFAGMELLKEAESKLVVDLSSSLLVRNQKKQDLGLLLAEQILMVSLVLMELKHLELAELASYCRQEVLSAFSVVCG